MAENGRFKPGHAGGPGRPKGQTLSAELRRQADMEQIAGRVLARLLDPRTSNRDFTELCKLLGDRTEGKAIARNMTMQITAGKVLPPGFESMTLEAKQAVLRDIRERALTGEIDVDE